MIRLDILGEKLSDVDFKITKYVNDNTKEIIRQLIDYLEDDNDFTVWDFLPENNFSISDKEWLQMVYDLYSMISSSTLRDYVKPKYQYLLYSILDWYQKCFEGERELLSLELDKKLSQMINVEHPSEDGESYVLRAITDYEEYYYLFFDDHDFLPDSLEKMVMIYLRSQQMFSIFYPDVDLDEYYDLMPNDLKELYDDTKTITTINENVNIDSFFYEDIIFCCETVQSDFSLKNAKENVINDNIRNLLRAREYEAYDQTRHGSSSAGEDAGNVDILVRLGRKSITLIEALKLDSVRKEYISEHIDRIYKYDTLGFQFNYLISYVETKDFKDFCLRYIKFVQELKYPYKLVDFIIDDSKQYPEMRTLETILDREGLTTKLYHIIIHMAN